MAKVKYDVELRRITGRNEEEIPSVSVKALLKEIERRYGKAAYAQAKRSMIAVDGLNCLLLKGNKTELSSESMVCFYPICGGG